MREKRLGEKLIYTGFAFGVITVYLQDFLHVFAVNNHISQKWDLFFCGIIFALMFFGLKWFTAFSVEKCNRHLKYVDAEDLEESDKEFEKEYKNLFKKDDDKE